MRFTLFMIFFDVSMVVMAQQAPRTLSFVNAEISAICGDDPSPYIERIRLLYRISSNLALEQLECCRASRRPTPAPPSPGFGRRRMPPVKNTWGFPKNPRPVVIVVHRLPIISTAKRSDRKMTGYNPASAPSPMSRTLVTTDAADASFFLHDANKNVMQRTDAEGNLLEKYEYAPSEGTRGRTEQASASPPRHSTPRQTSTTTTTGTMRRGSENGQRWIPSMKKDDSLGRTMIVF